MIFPGCLNLLRIIRQAVQRIAAVFQMLGDDMDDIRLALDITLNVDQPRRHDNLSVLRHHLGPDHKVGDAGLILQRDEADAFRAAWALAD